MKTKEEIEVLVRKCNIMTYQGIQYVRVDQVTEVIEQSQQDNKPVDVEKLRARFFEWVHKQDRNKLTIEETFDWFKPFLNTSEDKEAFAIGFFEFIQSGSPSSKPEIFNRVEGKMSFKLKPTNELLQLYKASLPQPPKQD